MAVTRAVVLAVFLERAPTVARTARVVAAVGLEGGAGTAAERTPEEGSRRSALAASSGKQVESGQKPAGQCDRAGQDLSYSSERAGRADPAEGADRAGRASRVRTSAASGDP
ncbi:hypothetical protein GCM10027569_33920 [Flindersiella endophytica]